MGQSKQTTKSSTGPWGPTQEALQSTIPQIQQQYETDKNNPLVPQATDYLSGAIRGDYLDPNTNPHLGALTKAITDPIQASVSAQFGRSGRGTSASASGLGGAMTGAMTSGLAAPLFQQYNVERGLQQGAAQMAPAMQAAGSLPLDQMLERLRALGGLGQESTSTTTASPSPLQTISGVGLSALGMMGGGNPLSGMLPWLTGSKGMAS